MPIVGWFIHRALPVLLAAVIALAMLVIVLYVMFGPSQCAAGTSPAASCAAAPF